MKRLLTALVLTVFATGAWACFDVCDDDDDVTPLESDTKVGHLLRFTNPAWHERTFVLLAGAKVCVPWLHNGPAVDDKTFLVPTNCKQWAEDIAAGDESNPDWDGPLEVTRVVDNADGCLLRKGNARRVTNIQLGVSCDAFAQEVIANYPY
jgi:hypothetical protein